MKKMHWMGTMVLVLIFSCLTGCGGGGGSSPVPTVSGVAATGAPLANASITLVDAKGAVKPSTTDSNGNYTITTTDMTPPFVIKADAGAGKFLYSYSATTGTVNVNPFSDLIVRSAAAGGTPETSTSAIQTNLTTAKNQLNNTFAAMLTAYSVPSGYDPITSSYAIGNAIDKLLDDISVSVASGAVTVKNKSSNATIYSGTVTSQGAFGGVLTAGNIPTPSNNNTGGTTYLTADLNGTWSDHQLIAADSPEYFGWFYGNSTFNNGTMTASNGHLTSGTVSGSTRTVSLSSAGIMVNTAVNLHGVLSKSKNVFVETHTEENTAAALTISLKKSGTYTTADLAGEWNIYGLRVGDGTTANLWFRGATSASTSGVFTSTSMTRSNGDTTLMQNLTLTIGTDGTISSAASTTLNGMMSNDKSIFVMTLNDGSAGTYDIAIFVKASATFTQADLAGTWSAHQLSAGNGANTNTWAYGTYQIDASGNATQTITGSSTGIIGTDTKSYTLASNGLITIPGSSFHGVMSSDKSFAVFTVSDTNRYWLGVLVKR